MTTHLIQADITQYLQGNQWLAQRGYIEKYQAVLCDPPYYLGSIVKRFGADNAAPAQYGSDGVYQRASQGFMGQTWDGFDSPQAYQAWVTEWATLILDFMHPGAVGLFFGGTRTYHRLVCGLENAGWEIYDSIIAWTYGSGFCKSHNIGKGIDKQAGMEREVVSVVKGSGRMSGDSDYQSTDYGSSWNGVKITAPATPEAANWEGYGTALAPSYEPIVIARAPRQGLTYAECALQFGTGALNIDGGRIGINTDDLQRIRNSDPKKSMFGVGPNYGNNLGRWPKNTLLVHHPACTDAECVPGCHVRVMGEQSGVSISKQSLPGFSNGYSGGLDKRRDIRGHDDSGSAARFFAQFRYVPKSPGWERSEGVPAKTMLKARDDLAPEKRDWLANELKRRGIV